MSTDQTSRMQELLAKEKCKVFSCTHIQSWAYVIPEGENGMHRLHLQLLMLYLCLRSVTETSDPVAPRKTLADFAGKKTSASGGT